MSRDKNHYYSIRCVGFLWDKINKTWVEDNYSNFNKPNCTYHAIAFDKRSVKKIVRKALSYWVKKERVTVTKKVNFTPELRSIRQEAVRFAGMSRRLKTYEAVAEVHAYYCYTNGVSIPRSLRRFLKV